jgi:hypothetical protein
MTTLSAAAALCKIPKTGIPEYGVTVISYIGEDGEEMFGWATHGQTNRSSMVGLLAMASHYMIHMPEDEDDDD